MDNDQMPGKRRKSNVDGTQAKSCGSFSGTGGCPVGFNGEFERLRLRHGALRERVANEIEMYTHLVTTRGPNIEAKYMMLVGQLECQAMALDMTARRKGRGRRAGGGSLHEGRRHSRLPSQQTQPLQKDSVHRPVAQGCRNARAGRRRHCNRGKVSRAVHGLRGRERAFADQCRSGIGNQRV